MQTIERVDTDQAPVDNQMLDLQKQNRWLRWLSGALAVAVIALGAWLIFDGRNDSPTMTAEQEQMLETIDTYLAALNDGDAAGAIAVMAPSAYHDNGVRYTVAEGRFENFINGVLGQGFSVSRTDAAFVGNFVFTTDHIPADSTIERPSLFKMTPDGSTILWHYAP